MHMAADDGLDLWIVSDYAPERLAAAPIEPVDERLACFDRWVMHEDQGWPLRGLGEARRKPRQPLFAHEPAVLAQYHRIQAD